MYEVPIQDLTKFIAHAEKIRIEHDGEMVRPAIMVVGPPQTAKTALIRTFARTYRHEDGTVGADFRCWHWPSKAPEDIQGIPQFCDGGFKWARDTYVESLYNAEKYTVAMCDEVGGANQAMQKVAAQWSCDRIISGDKLSPNVQVFMATNRPGDGAGSDAGILSHIKGGRVMIINLAIDKGTIDWYIEWLHSTGRSCEEVVHFLLSPEYGMTYFHRPPSAAKMREIEAWPGMRSHEKACAIVNSKPPRELLPALIESVYGSEATAAFMNLYKIRAAAPPWDDIEARPSKAKLPTDQNGRLATAVMISCRTNKSNWANIFEYVERWRKETGDAEYAALAVKGAMKRDRDIIRAKGFESWLSRNKELYL